MNKKIINILEEIKTDINKYVNAFYDIFNHTVRFEIEVHEIVVIRFIVTILVNCNNDFIGTDYIHEIDKMLITTILETVNEDLSKIPVKFTSNCNIYPISSYQDENTRFKLEFTYSYCSRDGNVNVMIQS